MAAARASDPAGLLDAMPQGAIIGSLTIPGRPEHVREARAFAAK